MHFSLHSVFLRDSGRQGRLEGAQPFIKSALKSGKDLSQLKRTAITTRIARMLALDLQPYIFVKNRGFKGLMNHMELLVQDTQPHDVFEDNHPGVVQRQSRLSRGECMRTSRKA
ncbi:hypothetical protein HPB49_025628 [Dermacentor silvarum]|uniref:Uncharacterized protein n=1 Tax=Dermacentor silvarum TaxID=543639 RepID=A0ACB8CUF5_DERSI|nr:hypothetical protein HPB49_025628 [Dermacentor silvarum]